MVRIWPHITGRSLLTGPWNIDFIKVQTLLEDAYLLPRVDDNFPSTTCNPDRNPDAVDGFSCIFSRNPSWWVGFSSERTD